MSSLIEEIRRNEDLVSLTGVTSAVIEDAEEKLELKFSDEYKSYLTEFGDASFAGHELTGIIESPRLNVIDVTIRERVRKSKTPHNLYVVEKLGIDDIVIWQDEAGAVYQTVGDSNPTKIKNSLYDYVKSLN